MITIRSVNRNSFEVSWSPTRHFIYTKSVFWLSYLAHKCEFLVFTKCTQKMGYHNKVDYGYQAYDKNNQNVHRSAHRSFLKSASVNVLAFCRTAYQNC